MSMDLLVTIFKFIIFIAQIYYYGLIVYIFMSWLPGARDSKFGEFMAKMYEPYLEPFRKIIPPIGMIDISSLVAIVVVHFFMKGLQSIFNYILVMMF
ncbi:YggT family protein [Staphylococcus massiliensis]|uniref:YggT family protein n=1 Tax=Staphylococcus massiliensis S46 TaxID=1229783 RepID=K9ASP6_9STAP|nr:YggT family protein [Staphylococcus massiliensis]EKU50388.1 hypothetical protein C273_00155 [Staphylococcus massiliensis S46]MCG3398842.1 YggT family protein [Staphylococcus massiliensis]MCG3401403.1 YggT family protein [Staphylococcus massiliensis]MCG3411815.1 YggT family protein [Staphylococcus massiliensis]PNZ99746.1 YggT family protein [Staphylococcus massiliensis CCUG 55927]